MSLNHLSFVWSAERYIRYLRATKAKSPLTITKEESSLNGWCNFFGPLTLPKIKLEDLREYASARAETGVTNRTINLDVVALNNMLVWYAEAGHLKTPLVTEKWRTLKHVTPKRTLLPDDAVDRIAAEATRCDEEGGLVYPNGPFLADFVKLLACSGARRNAALLAKWKNVNWEMKQITFETKFDKLVTVDFNPKLEAHLTYLKGKSGTSEYLFPGARNNTVKNAPELLENVRDKVGLPDVTFHDFRHYFISKCIMQGIDTQTVAAWVGHSDGGTLINRTYCHLSNAHRAAQAQKITF